VALGYLLVALLGAAVAVFALQNSAQTRVTFLMWTLEGLSLAAVALASLGIGLAVAGLPLCVTAWRSRSRARASAARIAALERALAERDQMLLRAQQPPEPPASRPPLTS
jgi:uncharacterized integral membrane protein